MDPLILPTDVMSSRLLFVDWRNGVEMSICLGGRGLWLVCEGMHDKLWEIDVETPSVNIMRINTSHLGWVEEHRHSGKLYPPSKRARDATRLGRKCCQAGTGHWGASATLFIRPNTAGVN